MVGISFTKAGTTLNHCTTINHFEIKNLRVTCTDPTVQTPFRANTFVPKMTIKGDGTFNRHISRGAGAGVTIETTVKGQLHGKAASGTVKETRSAGGGAVVCKSGQEPWTAQRD